VWQSHTCAHVAPLSNRHPLHPLFSILSSPSVAARVRRFPQRTAGRPTTPAQYTQPAPGAAATPVAQRCARSDSEHAAEAAPSPSPSAPGRLSLKGAANVHDVGCHVVAEGVDDMVLERGHRTLVVRQFQGLGFRV